MIDQAKEGGKEGEKEETEEEKKGEEEAPANRTYEHFDPYAILGIDHNCVSTKS